MFYDAATGERQRSISLPSAPRQLCSSTSATKCSARIDRSDFVLWDLATGHERLRLPGYNGVNRMAISPDGSRLVLGKPSRRPPATESELTLWSLKSGRRLLAFNRPGSVSAHFLLARWQPPGRRIFAIRPRRHQTHPNLGRHAAAGGVGCEMKISGRRSGKTVNRAAPSAMLSSDVRRYSHLVADRTRRLAQLPSSSCRWCTTSCGSWRRQSWPMRSRGRRSRQRRWCTRRI